MRARFPLWLAAVALIVLATRWLTYALAEPSPLARRFEATAGGPGLVVVTLVSLTLAAAASASALWLVSTGVRERQRLRPERELPVLRLRRVVLRAVALGIAGSLAFALLESYVHWRAGLGFHGLSCLFGPVHRNALPLVAALSLLAAALAESVQHLHAWLRAAVRELLRPRLVLPGSALPAARVRTVARRPRPLLRARPRAPPALT